MPGTGQAAADKVKGDQIVMEYKAYGEKKNNAKTALITGASRGIGAAIAEAFAGEGWQLYLTCLHSYPKLQQHARKLSDRYGISCTAIQADMGSYAQVEQLFASLDTLDVLVNNAGISHIGLLSDMTPEEWDRILSVNLSSCFYTSKHAITRMLQKHAGRIINISSVWGNVGASMEVAYSASKGGLNSFTKALAKELAPSNIQVNAIACGIIDTQMNASFSARELAALQQEIPADRLGMPEEVAALTLQLVHAPAYLTGQILTLDGGWY